MDVTLGADLLGLPSGLIGGEGSTITEVGEVGKSDTLNSGGVGLALHGKVESLHLVFLLSVLFGMVIYYQTIKSL